MTLLDPNFVFVARLTIRKSATDSIIPSIFSIASPVSVLEVRKEERKRDFDYTPSDFLCVGVIKFVNAGASPPVFPKATSNIAL